MSAPPFCHETVMVGGPSTGFLGIERFRTAFWSQIGSGDTSGWRRCWSRHAAAMLRSPRLSLTLLTAGLMLPSVAWADEPSAAAPTAPPPGPAPAQAPSATAPAPDAAAPAPEAAAPAPEAAAPAPKAAAPAPDAAAPAPDAAAPAPDAAAPAPD